MEHLPTEIKHLPTEMCLAVCSFFSEQELLVLLLVNKHWRRMALDVIANQRKKHLEHIRTNTQEWFLGTINNQHFATLTEEFEKKILEESIKLTPNLEHIRTNTQEWFLGMILGIINNQHFATLTEEFEKKILEESIKLTPNEFWEVYNQKRWLGFAVEK